MANELASVRVLMTCEGIKRMTDVLTVGRTGSGKSTLTLALLRCIPTEGSVVYDGIPTHTLNLDALRSNVTIIPQVVRLLLLSAHTVSHPAM